MDCIRLGTYLPAWEDATGRPVTTPDEDVLTMAVAAGRAALGEHSAQRIVLVCASPDFIEGSPATLLPAALGLPASTVVEQRIGGADAALDAITSGTAGTLVIGIDRAVPAGAGAALLGEGTSVERGSGYSRNLPITVRAIGQATASEYDDPRLLRDRGWRVALDAMLVGGRFALVGASAAMAKSAGADAAITAAVNGLTGAAATFFALAQLAGQDGDVELVAITGASATSALVSALGAEVVQEARGRQPVPRLTNTVGDIPVSLAGLDRAQDSKIGFLGGRCPACGHIDFPPRHRCTECGSEQTSGPAELGRTGTVYSEVTIHTPVPGKQTPYSIAIVDLDEPPLRVLAPITDAAPGTVKIGQAGRLVLRKVAMRQGVPDYMHAFQPGEGATDA